MLKEVFGREDVFCIFWLKKLLEVWFLGFFFLNLLWLLLFYYFGVDLVCCLLNKVFEKGILD